MNLEQKKTIATNWFRDLRNQICTNFQILSDEFAEHYPERVPDAQPKHNLIRKTWQRETDDGSDGGGGEISLIYSPIFEKAAVNISTVYGHFSEKFRDEIPGARKNDGAFWASGISLITHPRNPHLPPIHMNSRMIATSKLWFGGGVDLNPILPKDDDTKEFHHALKQCCDDFDKKYYPDFKQQADEYFFIKHRRRARGVGGIFYDYLENDNWQKDFELTQNLGKCFLQIYPQILRKNFATDYDESERQIQLTRRGYYTEFNLIYDRGTRFGLMTGGNVEAILASLPPLVAWQ